jgi:Poly A polymerase head domain
MPQQGPSTAADWNDRKEEANRNPISESQSESTPILSEIDVTSITSDCHPPTASEAPKEPLPFLSSDDFLPGPDHRACAAILRRALDLQDNEKEFIHELRLTINVINKNRPNQIDVLFTGGFVRDKLLGKQISNMDIVLLNISPAEFVQTLIDHHQWENHVKERLWQEYGFTERDAREKEREQNKTNRGRPLGRKERKGDGKTEPPKRNRVRTHCFDYISPAGNAIQVVGLTHFFHEINCEFVSFPRQVPTEEEVKAALVEDAMQRELTVNAIYMRAADYAILDPTGMGLKDIHDRILRTPKTPRETLLADPIRVLRAMKFVGRLYDDGFKPDPSLTQAMLTSQVKVRKPPSS